MQRRQLPDLLQAAARGNLTAVQRLLTQGERPDQKDSDGWTALHHAIGRGRILPGSDVPSGRPPEKALVEALLKAGAPLDARTKEGMTPLMQAVAAQYEDVARWLLDAGADLRPTDNVGGTALTLALWYNRCSRDFARLLIQRGSPVNLWDALWLGDTPQALILTEKVDVRKSGPNGFTKMRGMARSLDLGRDSASSSEGRPKAVSAAVPCILPRPKYRLNRVLFRGIIPW